MASADDRKELVEKLKALCVKRFGKADAWPELFAAYDGDKDGAINTLELVELLAAADVGNSFSRGFWVTGIFEEMDRDKSESVTLAELNDAIATSTPPKSTGKPLTRADARALAKLLIDKPGVVDTMAFSQADLSLLEEENAKLSGIAKQGDPSDSDNLGVTKRPAKVKPGDNLKAKQGDDLFGQIMIGVLVGVITLSIMKKL
jgi:hypothetical protein